MLACFLSNISAKYYKNLLMLSRVIAKNVGMFFETVYIYTLCSKKSDAKIQITITTAYLIRIKYPVSSFNCHLSDVNVANFNKIHRIVSEQQLF